MALQMQTETQSQTFFVCPKERAFAWAYYNQESREKEQVGPDGDLWDGAVMCLTHDHERD